IHGLNDEVVFPQGSINYYLRVAAQMGGIPAVQRFFRLYFVPGMGHADVNGSSNVNAPIPIPTHDQTYKLLTDWVEKGIEPGRVDIATPPGLIQSSQPICPYPQKATYQNGNPFVATSYVCG